MDSQMSGTFALAAAHSGARALAHGLCAVNWQGSMAGGNDFGFSHFFALADDVVTSSNVLHHSER
jgi:hypothetical protein